HFPDELALFEACTAHWLAGQVPPDPSVWAGIEDPAERLRTGLADAYRFYREGEAMLTLVHRDWDFLPEEHRGRVAAADAEMRDVLLAPFRARGARRRRLRAIIGHAIAFPTWRSLCVENALSDREAVDAMVALVLAAA
ncbi:MAG: TetR/AcrR family transcriptional regulator, partial [Dehalococcoidia bacterium]